MKITANGDTRQVPDGLNVTDLLAHLRVKMPDMVSVELNGEILERSRFAETIVHDGDAVEFLYFMGGGQGGAGRAGGARPRCIRAPGLAEAGAEDPLMDETCYRLAPGMATELWRRLGETSAVWAPARTARSARPVSGTNPDACRLSGVARAAPASRPPGTWA